MKKYYRRVIRNLWEDGKIDKTTYDYLCTINGYVEKLKEAERYLKECLRKYGYFMDYDWECYLEKRREEERREEE